MCVPGYSGVNCETRVENFGRFREVFDAKPPVSTPDQAPSNSASVAAVVNALPVEVKDAQAALLGEGTCAQSCGSNGVCVRDQCYCAPGFSGADCSSATPADQPTPSSAAPTPITPMALTSNLGLQGATNSNSASYVVIGVVAFIGGIVACLAAQVVWAWYQKRQRKLATQAILTPLLHTLDQ